MTIIKAATAPLFAVVGASGNQGGSVMRSIQASSKAYRVRAIGRDITKPIFKKYEEWGCEILSADVSTKDGAEKAFKDADIAFAITVSEYSDGAKEKEIAKGKTQMDACAALGVKQVIYTGMVHLGRLTGASCDLWDSKAEVAEYARSLRAFKLYDISTGTFFNNYLTQNAPRKAEDGTYFIAAPFGPDTKLPLIDHAEDFGKYAIGALENDAHEKTVCAAPEYVTPVQIVEAFSKVSGRTINLKVLTDAEYGGRLKGIFGEQLANGMVNTMAAVRTVGYYGGEELEESNQLLSTPARKLPEMVEAHKDRILALFA
ncbi:NAD(P)-binding protein [Atractiella rhizophila]|nr:NAD(P)-binding protein [Atractiella rhizophila]KAH8930110.1 NAD(P)-binding protein [Atractiella rhizophila]